MSESFADNPERSRFELAIGGQIVFANYRRMGDSLAITHVEAPVPLRGTGAAGRLMAQVIAAAHAEGRTPIAFCSYAASWLRRHPQAA